MTLGLQPNLTTMHDYKPLLVLTQGSCLSLGWYLPPMTPGLGKAGGLHVEASRN